MSSNLGVCQVHTNFLFTVAQLSLQKAFKKFLTPNGKIPIHFFKLLDLPLKYLECNKLFFDKNGTRLIFLLYFIFILFTPQTTIVPSKTMNARVCCSNSMLKGLTYIELPFLCQVYYYMHQPFSWCLFLGFYHAPQ